MKKILILVLCVLVTLTGCNSADTDTSKDIPTPEITEELATPQITIQPTPVGPYSYTDYTASQQILDDALVYEGNTNRIIAAMQKASRGEDIKIGVIGGSITWGASADIDKTYAKKLYRWWKKKFPESSIKLVNAGKSGTGSVIGVHRIEQDLLSKGVDFVIVEFAVNDTDDEEVIEAYESIIRYVLSHESKPGLMLLMMCADEGYSSEDSKIEIGTHYNVPIISYKSSVYAAVERGELVWDEIADDFIHPDNPGHLLIAETIIYRLEQYHKHIEDEVDIVIDLPESITDAYYTNVELLTNETLNVTSIGGFEKDNNANWVLPLGYKAVDKNNKFAFEVEAKTIVLVYNQLTNNMGANIFVEVDGVGYGMITSKSPFEWEAITSTEILRENSVEKHTITLTYTDEVPEECTGEEFKLLAVMIGK